MKTQMLKGQVSLFDVIAVANNAVRAFCIATNESVPVRQPNARQRENASCSLIIKDCVLPNKN